MEWEEREGVRGEGKGRRERDGSEGRGWSGRKGGEGRRERSEEMK